MKTIVICIGTGACQIAQRSLSQQVDEQFSLVFLDEEEHADVEKKQATCRLEEIAKNLSSDKDATIILFATLGGITGGKYVASMTSILKECGVKSYAVVTMPFSWEGEKRANWALEAFDNFKEAGCDIFAFMNDCITECIGDIRKGFAWADEKLSALIEAIATSTTDDFLQEGNEELFLHK